MRATGLAKPLVIGHSLGGAIGLELCGRYPDLACGLVMIDSIVTPPPAIRDHPEPRRLLDGIGGPDYLAVSRASAWDIGCDFDDPLRRKAIFDSYILPPCESSPQHVGYSTLRNFGLNPDPVLAARHCRIPMASISAEVPLVD